MYVVGNHHIYTHTIPPKRASAHSPSHNNKSTNSFDYTNAWGPSLRHGLFQLQAETTKGLKGLACELLLVFTLNIQAPLVIMKRYPTALRPHISRCWGPRTTCLCVCSWAILSLRVRVPEPCYLRSSRPNASICEAFAPSGCLGFWSSRRIWS